MKHLKAIIITVISIIIVVLVLLIALLRKDETGEIISNHQNTPIVEYEGTEDYKKDNEIQISDYFITNFCINNYLNYTNKNSSVFFEAVENNKQKYNETTQKSAVYNLLSKNYIQTNAITQENVLSKIELQEKKQSFYPLEIDEEVGQTTSSFKIKGIAKDTEDKNPHMVYCIVNLDYNNETYSIEPISEESYTNYKLATVESVERNDYNTYVIPTINEATIAREYLSMYKFITFANPKFSYEKMTEEYRNKRFGSLENYTQYLKDNYSELSGANAEEYAFNMDQNVPQYVVKDQYQNLYIFNAKSPLDYTVSLDTYTLENEKFNTTYDSAETHKKCQMNIDKFFQMINRQDYKTSLNVLADSFKQTSKITSEAALKNIANSIFFKYNKIEFVDFDEIGNDTYSYSIKLTDLLGQNKGEKKITIIMQLKENREFVMSFS